MWLVYAVQSRVLMTSDPKQQQQQRFSCYNYFALVWEQSIVMCMSVCLYLFVCLHA